VINNKKVGAHAPVLGVIYKKWAGKSDQVEQMSGIRLKNHSSQGVPSGSAASKFEPYGSRNMP
jgi:hypothetical protein